MSSETKLEQLPRGALVEGEAFVDVDVARVAAVEVYKCRFDNCRFVEASFDKVVFEAVEFKDCDLTRVKWGSSSLRGVKFIDCKLLGVNFAALNDNPDVSFERCLLRYAVFDGVACRGARFVDCNLAEANFNETDLRDADFSLSDFTLAVIKKCTLAGADFSTSTGLYFDPAANQSKDAFIAVETAVQIAQAAGLRVAGYDDAKGSKAKRRR